MIIFILTFFFSMIFSSLASSPSVCLLLPSFSSPISRSALLSLCTLLPEREKNWYSFHGEWKRDCDCTKPRRLCDTPVRLMPGAESSRRSVNMMMVMPVRDACLRRLQEHHPGTLCRHYEGDAHARSCLNSNMIHVCEVNTELTGSDQHTRRVKWKMVLLISEYCVGEKGSLRPKFSPVSHFSFLTFASDILKRALRYFVIRGFF